MGKRLSLVLVNLDIFMDRFADGGTEEQLEHYLMDFVQTIAGIYPSPGHLKEDTFILMTATAQALAMERGHG